MGLELGDNEEPKGEKAKGKEDKSLKEEGEELAFHELTGFDVEGGIAKETVDGLFNGRLFRIGAEFPVDGNTDGIVDSGKDAVSELPGGGTLKL